MVEDVLVGERTLSAEEIAVGEQLLNKLDSVNLRVVAAYWIYTEQTDFWRLELVTPEVDLRGPLEVYKMIHDVASEPIHWACYLQLNLLNVLGLKYSFYKKMLEAIRTEEPLVNIRLSKLVVGAELTDLYIYRFPSTLVPDEGSNHA